MAVVTSLPTLSVIIPNYNHGKYLPACLNAILRQSVTPLEVIILDDCSTDNSVEVVERFAAEDPIFRLIRNPKNLGVMPNVNKGVDLARGSMSAWVRRTTRSCRDCSRSPCASSPASRSGVFLRDWRLA